MIGISSEQINGKEEAQPPPPPLDKTWMTMKGLLLKTRESLSPIGSTLVIRIERKRKSRTRTS
jgi:hypothetical protein